MSNTEALPELPEPSGVIIVGTQALRAFTADQMHAYALQALAQPAQPDAELQRRTGEPHIDGWPLYSGLPPPATSGEPVAIAKIDLGFRWDGERLHHVPQLLIEFAAVPMNEPNDAKGWRDRDTLAAQIWGAAPQPAPAPAALLVRDIASDMGIKPLIVCKALETLGYGPHSVNMAITADMARALGYHFAAQPAPALVPPGWQPIETAPDGDRRMFVVIAANVAPTPTSRAGYTSDPWCVWRDDDGGFARWPHAFEPTHWMPLPAAPAAPQSHLQR